MSPVCGIFLGHLNYQNIDVQTYSLLCILELVLCLRLFPLLLQLSYFLELNIGRIHLVEEKQNYEIPVTIQVINYYKKVMFDPINFHSSQLILLPDK